MSSIMSSFALTLLDSFQPVFFTFPKFNLKFMLLKFESLMLQRNFTFYRFENGLPFPTYNVAVGGIVAFIQRTSTVQHC
jgi:hypothetical protein